MQIAMDPPAELLGITIDSHQITSERVEELFSSNISRRQLPELPNAALPVPSPLSSPLPSAAAGCNVANDFLHVIRQAAHDPLTMQHEMQWTIVHSS